MAAPLASMLLASFPPTESGAPSVDEAALQRQLQSMFDAGRSAWPNCTIEDVAFVRHVGSLISGRDALPEALAAMRAEDVYLACACTVGAAEALRTFEQQFIRPTRVVIARESDVIDPDEFFQRLRERLLVAREGKPSRLATFSGKGKLSNWVRIAAQRLLIDEYRKREAAISEVSDESVDPVRAAGVSAPQVVEAC
ncbi:MAG: hypothetical protein AAF721_25110, partial [Myxococcota bacterium]